MAPHVVPTIQGVSTLYITFLLQISGLPENPMIDADVLNKGKKV